MDGGKSVVGRICGRGKILAWNRTLKEGKQMKVVIMKITKMKNCLPCAKRGESEGN